MQTFTTINDGLVSPEHDNWTLTKNASVIKQEEQMAQSTFLEMPLRHHTISL
jgi:hypothetical protein